MAPTSNSIVDAVLFDMDGTLSDTEDLWQQAQTHIATHYGNGAIPEDSAHSVGASMEADAVFLRDTCGVHLPIPEIKRLTTEYVVIRLHEGFAWRPGARELLSDVKARHISTALVTSSPRSVADAIIEHLPAGSFDVIVTDDDVAVPKPDPEPYLTAAGLLGVDPMRCLVIEDTTNGALAGERAGCRVLVVAGQDSVAPTSQRTVVSSLSGLNFPVLVEYLGLDGS